MGRRAPATLARSGKGRSRPASSHSAGAPGRPPSPKTARPDPQGAWDVVVWPISRFVPFKGNPRKIDAQDVEQMAAAIREFGFKIPMLARSSGEIVDGHLRLKGAQKVGLQELPTILCDEWTEEQVKAFRLLVNRSVSWADWDEELLAVQMQELRAAEYDLAHTGFEPSEIDGLLLPAEDPESADKVLELPAVAVARPGDLWLLGKHRVICGDATSRDVVQALLGDRKPALMVTDPPYGIGLDSEWRDRAGLNSSEGWKPGDKRSRFDKRAARLKPFHPAAKSYMKHRTEGHTETSISGDTKADWSDAFELVPSLQVAYVWHASIFTREVLNGLLRIGFLYPQQIIWDKGRAVLTRTHYWYQHEPCWFVRKGEKAPWYGKPGADLITYGYEHEPLVYVRKKNAPWYGKAGENSTVWSCASPKFIMGGQASGDQKFDHPTQKPVELMRRPILNHTRRGEAVYEPFLGSGTTLAAAQILERVCYAVELDPKYVDVAILRWQELSGERATLDGDGRSFDEIRKARLKGKR